MRMPRTAGKTDAAHHPTLSTLYGGLAVNFVVFMPNASGRTCRASPLFPETAGEAADATPAHAESSAPETLVAAAPVPPQAPAPVVSPRAKRRVGAKSAAVKKPAAQIAVSQTAAPAAAAPASPAAPATEPDYSEWDPRFTEIKRCHSARSPVDDAPRPPLHVASFMTGAATSSPGPRRSRWRSRPPHATTPGDLLRGRPGRDLLHASRRLRSRRGR